jgi:hypothetical protein
MSLVKCPVVVSDDGTEERGLIGVLVRLRTNSKSRYRTAAIIRANGCRLTPAHLWADGKDTPATEGELGNCKAPDGASGNRRLIKEAAERKLGERWAKEREMRLRQETTDTVPTDWVLSAPDAERLFAALDELERHEILIGEACAIEQHKINWVGTGSGERDSGAMRKVRDAQREASATYSGEWEGKSNEHVDWILAQLPFATDEATRQNLYRWVLDFARKARRMPTMAEVQKLSGL